MFLGLVRRLGRRVKDERGLTLIELVAVVVILGVVAVLLIPRVLGRADTAKENAALSDIRAMKSVIEIYYSEHGELPDSGNIDDVMKENGVDWDNVKDPWDNGYGYKKKDDDSYTIASKGKRGAANDDENDDIYATDKLSPTTGKCGVNSGDATATSGGDTW
ncbi:MAG: type II secretion system protein GspG [Bacillota bacterium]